MSKEHISGYALTRAWFDFAFENQGKVTGNHGCMLMWFIEQNNRLGWVKEFGAPRDQTMAAVGISSYNTYKKVFNDLVEWGFVKIVKESKNQYTANIIALSNFDNAQYKALDNALYRQSDKHVNGTGTGTVAIIKPINKETSKPLNQKQNAGTAETVPVEDEEYSFEKFWDDYDKKVGSIEKLTKKWDKLKPKDRLAIKEHIPKYKLAQPKKQYRKNPETYLNNQSWNDEIIIGENGNKKKHGSNVGSGNRSDGRSDEWDM